LKNRSKVSAVIEAAVVFALVFVTSFYDVFYSFDSLLRDKLYQTPRGINNKIKIIAIDDETLREYGPFGTWSRGVYADIINTLGEYPAAVAMDIMVFGDMSWLSRIIYALVGICGLYLISFFLQLGDDQA